VNWPVGKNCRWSDAALIRYDTTADFSGVVTTTSGINYTAVAHFDSIEREAVTGDSMRAVGMSTGEIARGFTGGVTDTMHPDDRISW